MYRCGPSSRRHAARFSAAAAVLQLVLILLGAGRAGAQTKPGPGGGLPVPKPPSIEVTTVPLSSGTGHEGEWYFNMPAGDTRLVVWLRGCDDGPINAASLTITWNGASVARPGTLSPNSTTCTNEVRYDDVRVDLVPGDNFLDLRLCDGAGQCTDRRIRMVYTPPTVDTAPAVSSIAWRDGSVDDRGVPTGTAEITHPYTLTVTGSQFWVRVTFADDSVQTTTRTVTLNGAPANLVHAAPGSTQAFAEGTLRLNPGVNTLVARLCEPGGRCAERTVQVTSDVAGPVVTVTPAQGYKATLPDQTVTISWSDALSRVDTAGRRIVFNGTNITRTLTTEDGRSYGAVTLAPGENVLDVHICDRVSGTGAANCTDKRTTIYHVTGPRVAAVVDAASHPGHVLRPPTFDATLSYTTVPYFSLDVPRSATLVYRSSQAAPLGMVQLDVTEASQQTPVALSLGLLDETGTRVLLTSGGYENFFRAGAGLNRLSAQFQAYDRVTGAHAYMAVVRSHWSDGQVLETRVPLVVLIRNERSSLFGAGWTVSGLQRLHLQGHDVVLADGDGSLVFFRRGTCTHTGGAIPQEKCTFVTPAGESSELVRWTEGSAAPYYVRTYLDGSTTRFAANGTIVNHRSPQGETWSYEMRSDGWPLRMLPPFAGPMTFNYNASTGRLESLQDGYGRTTNVAVDGRNHLTTVYDPDYVKGLVVAYDTLSGRATTWTTREIGTGGGAMNILYYDRGFELSAVSSPMFNTPEGSKRLPTRFRSLPSLTLPATGGGTTLASPASRVHPDGLWLRVLPPLAADSVTFRVDPHGRTTHVRNREGRVTTIFRNRDGLDTLVAGPTDSVYTRWNGWRMTARIARNDTTRYEYDPRFGTLTRVVSPAGTDLLRAWYNARGLADSTWADPAGTTRFGYDGTGRVAWVRSDLGDTVAYTYQEAGTLGNTTAVTRNGYGEIYSRDVYGRVWSTSNSLGQTATTQWNALNQPVEAGDGVGGTVRMTYRAGNLATLTDANGQLHRFSHNSLGLEYMRTDPRGGVSRTEYTALARVDSAVNRRGQVTRFTYDTQGRPLSMNASDGSYVLYTYDDTARVTILRTPVSTDTLRASERGLLEHEGSVRAGRAYSTDRWTRLNYLVVDVMGLPAMYVPVVDAVTHMRDGSGEVLATRTGQTDSKGIQLRRRLSSEAGSFETAVHFGRDALDRVTQAARASHMADTEPWVTLEYGHDGTVKAVSHPELAGMSMRYHRDRGGRVTSRAMGTDSTVFGYDARGRLSSYRVLTPGGTLSSGAYTYDAGGNRTDGGAVLENGNRIMAFDGWQFAYDADGNLVRRYKPGVADQTLAWNAFGQLTSVTTAGGGTVTFQYDGLGRRIRKTGPQGSIDYVYDGRELALEVNAATGEVLASYLYLPGIDRPYAMQRGGLEYRYVTDELGSVLGLERNGALVNRYRYDPWGRAELAEETVPNPFRFAGREWDAETGLYYVRARYYDPVVGRFISEDPSHLAGGLNLYAYAANNPVSFTDPSGLEPCRVDQVSFWQREEYEALSPSDKKIVDDDPCAWVEPATPILLDPIQVRLPRDLACANPYYATFHPGNCDESAHRFQERELPSPFGHGLESAVFQTEYPEYELLLRRAQVAAQIRQDMFEQCMARGREFYSRPLRYAGGALATGLATLGATELGSAPSRQLFIRTAPGGVWIPSAGSAPMPLAATPAPGLLFTHVGSASSTTVAGSVLLSGGVGFGLGSLMGPRLNCSDDPYEF